ncbi:hypothetical protein M3204_16680 [Mesobacillus subterraneus]|uniref:hypothetical protein n=1 Tax=Mesobacillus subterraneus TaxID=285983 RepID=UPI00203FC581|nr:hypothetical protein [Mesobacillus subterraneus]MCM3666055.1 hypothetical protein [Mesobacillus subterraneus]MCM3684938.1 hypothetical protein [Mesobacillus subterraneus]
MEKKEQRGQSFYDYDDQGIEQVSQQIMDSYNSGVVGQEQMKAAVENNEELR